MLKPLMFNDLLVFLASVFVILLFFSSARYVLATLSLISLIGLLTALFSWTSGYWQAVSLTGFFCLSCCLATWLALKSGTLDTAKKLTLGTALGVVALIAALPSLLFPPFTPPNVSGPHKAGTISLTLVDRSRQGVLGAPENQPRLIPMKVWYPGAPTPTARPEPYMASTKARHTLAAAAQNYLLPGFLLSHFAHADSHSFLNAKIVPPTKGLYPLVLFSHGYGLYAEQNTALMEHLASNGYIVLSITHLRDAADYLAEDGTVIPTTPEWRRFLREHGLGPSEAQKTHLIGASYDSRYKGVQTVFEEAKKRGDRLVTQSADVWVADHLFVAKSLAELDVPAELKSIMAYADRSAIAHMGMSFGGSTAAAACYANPKCGAAVNLDGWDFHEKLDAEIPAPLLLLQGDWRLIYKSLADGNPVDEGFAPGDFSYERHINAGNRADIYRLRINNTAHFGFSDLAYLTNPPLRQYISGPIDADLLTTLINESVRTFLDKHLRNKSVNFPDTLLTKYPDNLFRHTPSKVQAWKAQQSD